MRGTGARIQEYIQRSAVAELFNEDMELDMAFEYLSISQDFVGDLRENMKEAKKYCQKPHLYKFSYGTVDEFFPLIRKYLRTCKGTDFEGGLIEYLGEQTSLDEINICLVIRQWERLFS